MASGSGQLQTTRRKPAEGDSPDKYERLPSKSTEVCGHCNKDACQKVRQYSVIYAIVGSMQVVKVSKKIIIDCCHKL